ncbi:NAD(+) synthase [Spiroplasma sp. DGKH1]|uniref:NAD(+) synthase n=1 Tax=Spiroplasma sp. DGKH1 TaxID=3050074 RepID=UPI0034C6BB57
MKNLQDYLDYLVTWIRQEVTVANCQGVIIGLSGGIDSAVVALLGQKAFPNNHLTVIMPCHSDPVDQEYSLKLVNHHQLTSQVVDLTTTYDELVKNLPLSPTNKLALANIKPRLRMTTLYALAQAHQYLVLGTDNADEWHLGYFTKYGDGGVDLVPIIHLLKGEVCQAAELLGVCPEIITRKPTAGLWANQTDEDELGFSYHELDNYLQGFETSPTIEEKIQKLHAISEHKRKLAQAPAQPFTKLKYPKES